MRSQITLAITMPCLATSLVKFGIVPQKSAKVETVPWPSKALHKSHVGSAIVCPLTFCLALVAFCVLWMAAAVEEATAPVWSRPCLNSSTPTNPGPHANPLRSRAGCSRSVLQWGWEVGVWGGCGASRVSEHLEGESQRQWQCSPFFCCSSACAFRGGKAVRLPTAAPLRSYAQRLAAGLPGLGSGRWSW